MPTMTFSWPNLPAPHYAAPSAPGPNGQHQVGSPAPKQFTQEQITQLVNLKNQAAFHENWIIFMASIYGSPLVMHNQSGRQFYISVDNKLVEIK